MLDVVRDTAPARVYNFELESLPGEITHNYMVGDDMVWVHNSQKWTFVPWNLTGQLLQQMGHYGMGQPIMGEGEIICPIGGTKFQITKLLPGGRKATVHYMTNAAGIIGDVKWFIK